MGPAHVAGATSLPLVASMTVLASGTGAGVSTGTRGTQWSATHVAPAEHVTLHGGRHAPAGNGPAPHIAASADEPATAHVLDGGPDSQLALSEHASVQVPQMQSPLGQSAGFVHAPSQLVSLPPALGCFTLPPHEAKSAASRLMFTVTNRAADRLAFISTFPFSFVRNHRLTDVRDHALRARRGLVLAVVRFDARPKIHAHPAHVREKLKDLAP
jgi:hypothetical protein